MQHKLQQWDDEKQKMLFAHLGGRISIRNCIKDISWVSHTPTDKSNQIWLGSSANFGDKEQQRHTVYRKMQSL